MNPDLAQHFSLRQRQLLVIVLYALVTMLSLVFITDVQVLDFTLNRGVVYVIGFVVTLLTLAFGITAMQWQGHWFDYGHLSVLIIWFILGPVWALIMYLTAVFVVFRMYHSSKPVSTSFFSHAFFLRLSISILALSAAALVYQILPGELTIQDSGRIPLNVITALLINVLVLLGLKRFVVSVQTTRGEILDIITHLLLVHFIVFVMPPVYTQLGLIPFIFGMAMLALLAKRQQQTNQVRADLRNQDHEIRLANQLTRDISSTLEMDDILLKLQHHLSQQIDMAAFYAAILDVDGVYVNYPLSIVDEKRLHWPSRPVQDDPLMRFAIRHPQSSRFLREDTPEFFNLMLELPDTRRFAALLVYPLNVGAKLIGLVAVYCHPSYLENADRTLEIMIAQVSLAVRNAALYKRRSHLADNLSLMNQTVQDVMFSLSSEDAVRAACKMAQKIAGTQKVAILLFDLDNKTHFVLAYAEGLTASHSSYYSTTLYSPEHIPDSFTTISDVYDLNERDIMRELSVMGAFRAYAEIPLRSGDMPIGVLLIFHDLPHHYDETELKLMEILGYQLTAALDYTELLSALELYASEQAQLVHLTRITTSSSKLPNILENVAELTRQMMNVTYVYLAISRVERRLSIYDGSRTLIENMTVEHIPELNVLFTTENPMPRVFYPTDDHLSLGMTTFLRQYGDAVLMMIPLVVNKQAFGALFLGSSDERHFTDSEWRLLEMATNQIATQLYNVLAFEDTEAALGRRLQQMAFIERIAEQISRSLDVAQLIQNVLESAIYATQAELATLSLVNDDNQMDVVIREFQHGEWFDSEMTVSLDAGNTGKAIQQGEIRVVPDNQTDVDYHAPPQYRGMYRSSLIVPLVGEDRVIGALNLESSELNFFNEERVEFARNLAGHTVISIQNARLYARIRQQRDQTRAILNSAYEGIIMLDQVGRLIQANPGAEQLLSLALGEHLGENFVELLNDHLDTTVSTKDDVSLREALEEMMRVLQDEPRRVTTRRYSILVNRYTKHIEEVGTPVLDSEGQVMGRLLTLRDISEERQLAEYRDEISNMVVHDLRGPLGAIISSISLTLEIIGEIEDEDKSEAVNTLMNVSLDSASSLLDMVDSLLDIAKLENQRMPILYTPTRIADLINSAYLTLQTSLEKAGIEYEQIIPNQLPPVHVDPDKIRRVMVNLLDNASRYTPSGGKVRVSVERLNPQQIIVRVADSGVGIPMSEVEHIFDKFRQVQGSKPFNGSKGTGLGLTFCKLAIEAHGEKIWVESNGPLPGACFSFTLTTL